MFSVILPVALVVGSALSPAAESLVTVTVFVREDCVHCSDLKEYLASVENIRVDLRDVDAPHDREAFTALARAARVPLATPLTFIHGAVISGFDSPAATGPVLQRAIAAARSGHPVTLADYLRRPQAFTSAHRTIGCDETGGDPCDDTPLFVRIPFTSATFDIRDYSLPALAAVLGFIDGFNPCAMWVLVTFLIVLLQLQDRWRMFQIAGLFIVAETLMYYAILNIWFTTWDFVGLDRVVTPLVGVLALGSGLYFLYEGAAGDGTCKVARPETRRRTHSRIHALAANPLTLLTGLGIIGLAFSVNVIEFACSIGIPQTFTKVLELNEVAGLAKQGLMALYILGYMMDDFLVFGLALWGANYVGLTQRYARLSHVIGGALMIALGAVLLAAPELLRTL